MTDSFAGLYFCWALLPTLDQRRGGQEQCDNRCEPISHTYESSQERAKEKIHLS
jgi:hypothetical protein